MAIATKPKPTIHHKKRRAQHHRKNKLYLKSYWPYLPMVAIVGVGAVINQTLYGVSLGSSGWLAADTPIAPTRLDALTGKSSWSLLAITVTAVAAIILVATHWYRFHRLVRQGEAFAARHPWFDLILVTIITVGFVLTRNA